MGAVHGVLNDTKAEISTREEAGRFILEVHLRKTEMLGVDDDVEPCVFVEIDDFKLGQAAQVAASLLGPYCCHVGRPEAVLAEFLEAMLAGGYTRHRDIEEALRLIKPPL